MKYIVADTKEIQKAVNWLRKYWGKSTYPELFQVNSINEAMLLSKEYGEEAMIVAGNIDVLGLMKNRVISPRVLISLKNIEGLKFITRDEKGLTIGALTLITELEKSELIQTHCPILQKTAQSIGSPQIRNAGTLAGNLCQDVRCWYYRRSPATGNSFKCCRKTGSGQCYAVNGENQYHALIDKNPCLGVCPSDLATSLLSLNAHINIVNLSGGRSISIDELYTPLGNSLRKDEIISSIQIPEVSPGTRQRFLKFRLRKAIDFAIVSVASVLTFEKDIISDARVVLGGVTFKPYRSIEAEEILKGEKTSVSLAAEAARAAIRELTPLSKNDYKVPILEALVKRAILE